MKTANSKDQQVTFTEGDQLSYKVNDVPNAFKDLPETGVYEKFTGLPYFSNIAVEHIQGYTQYQTKGGSTYFVFSHHTDGQYGNIILAPTISSATRLRIEKGWAHPGGIQAVGKYLFVPCEKDKKSKIFIYDIEMLKTLKKDNDAVAVKTFDFDKHKASCVGITDYIDNSKSYYLMMIVDKEKYYAYKAEICENIANLEFSPIGEFTLEGRDCQGIGLITDKNGSIYMIGLMSHGSGLTYADWAYMYKLSVAGGKIQQEKEDGRHLKNKGGITGVDGTHFRWGAGIRVTPDGRLVILATSRNIIAGTKLDTTFWCK